MKRLLLADDRADLQTQLGPILKHWGYEVAIASSAEQASAFLREGSPALVLIGAQFLGDPRLQWPVPVPPCIALQHPDAAEASPPAISSLTIPVDIFELYRQIQVQIEEPPRKNLRLRLRLPGMYSQGRAGYVVAELLSLSTGGLLFRSPLRVKVGTRVNAIFPLLGHGKEVEVTGTVLYLVEPGPHNHYTQGFGLSFSDLTAEQEHNLRVYLEENFYEQLAAGTSGAKPLP